MNMSNLIVNRDPQDMRKAFEQESLATSRPSLLMTAAVPAGKSYIDGGYDIPLIMQ